MYGIPNSHLPPSLRHKEPAEKPKLPDTASGVQSFSSPQIAKVIFSADEPFSANYVSSFLGANGIDYLPIEGSWEGVIENSWAIPQKDFKLVKDLAKNQKTFLFLGQPNGAGQRKASLFWNETGKVEELGYLCQVSEKEARSRSGWSSFWQSGGKGFAIEKLWFSCYQLDKFGQRIIN